MGDIGSPIRHIEVEPLPAEAPAHEPAAPVAPAPQPEEVPA